MGQIFVAACSALFVCLGVGIPAEILKHISWLCSFSVLLGNVGTWQEWKVLQSTVTDRVIAPHVTSLSLLGFSAIVNPRML